MRSSFTRRIGLLALLTTVLRPDALAAPATLRYETECLDLDAGQVASSCDDLRNSQTYWDVRIVFDAGRTTHAVVLHNQAAGVEVADVTGIPYDDVTAGVISGAAFTSELLDVPFDGDRVLLVRTDLGAVFKIGAPLAGESDVGFRYQELDPAP